MRLRILERLIGNAVDREAVIAYRTRRKTELYSRAPLLPGVRERLAEAQQRGMKTAIVTRNSDERVKAQCDIVALHHQWQAVICANEDPTRSKADLYRHALEVLEVHANQALAFEDSLAGVRAAKRAQVLCAAVPNVITRGAAFGAADIVLSSLAEHSPDEILTMATGS